MDDEIRTTRRIVEMSDDDAKKLEWFIEHKEEIDTMMRQRRAYAIVSKRVKVILTGVAAVVGAIVLLHDKISAYIAGIVS